jgi:methionine-rich copper-binding protein CopC
MNTTRVVRTFAIAVAVSGAVVTAAAAAWHLDLTDSYPRADQLLSEPPDTIRLWFNQVPELSLSAISLEGAGGRIDMGKPQATDDPKSFKAEVLEQIEAGSYQVIWRAAGSDGHAIRGRYGFEVRSVAGSEQ